MARIDIPDLLRFLGEQQPRMVAMLANLVEHESPSNHKPSLDLLGELLARELQGLGAEVQVLPQGRAGDHVLARWGQGEAGVLLLGHMDTVWDIGTLAQRPVRVEDGKIFGAGAEDMKGGIVVGVWALRALRSLGQFPSFPVTFLLTSDEEIGSGTSRTIIEAEARRSRAVFVLEPAEPPLGSYKTQRKGVGEYRVEVTGRASHAGVDHQKGRNALLELAHQILAIQDFTDYATGTTCNVGVAAGGTRTNVVPANAWAEIDVRARTVAEASRIDRLLRSLRPHLDGTHLDVTGGFDRLPLERTPAVAALFERACSLAGEMGIALTEAATGGASDGNITAGLGIPTLDGMGVVGDGGHSTQEYAVLDSLPERAAILAAMLATL